MGNQPSGSASDPLTEVGRAAVAIGGAAAEELASVGRGLSREFGLDASLPSLPRLPSVGFAGCLTTQRSADFEELVLDEVQAELEPGLGWPPRRPAPGSPTAEESAEAAPTTPTRRESRQRLAAQAMQAFNSGDFRCPLRTVLEEPEPPSRSLSAEQAFAQAPTLLQLPKDAAGARKGHDAAPGAALGAELAIPATRLDLSELGALREVQAFHTRLDLVDMQAAQAAAGEPAAAVPAPAPPPQGPEDAAMEDVPTVAAWETPTHQAAGPPLSDRAGESAAAAATAFEPLGGSELMLGTELEADSRWLTLSTPASPTPPAPPAPNGEEDLAARKDAQDLCLHSYIKPSSVSSLSGLLGEGKGSPMRARPSVPLATSTRAASSAASPSSASSGSPGSGAHSPASSRRGDSDAEATEATGATEATSAVEEGAAGAEASAAASSSQGPAAAGGLLDDTEKLRQQRLAWQAKSFLEVFSASRGEWFVGRVYRVDAGGENGSEGVLLVHFFGEDGVTMQKALPRSDAQLAVLGSHCLEPPVLFRAVPSVSRPGQMTYEDLVSGAKYRCLEHAWAIHFDRAARGEATTATLPTIPVCRPQEPAA